MVAVVRNGTITVHNGGQAVPQTFQASDRIEVACTSGSAFLNSNSFTRTKTLECQADGSWVVKEADLASASCVRTCPVPYSNHDPSVAVTAGGNAVQAFCKAGYAVQPTGGGQTFSQCSNSKSLTAYCQLANAGSTPRLDFECMKVTCGALLAHPVSVVTVVPPANSRYSDHNDENGLERERTKVTCGKKLSWCLAIICTHARID
jgi:hypothetical protein